MQGFAGILEARMRREKMSSLGFIRSIRSPRKKSWIYERTALSRQTTEPDLHREIFSLCKISHTRDRISAETIIKNIDIKYINSDMSRDYKRAPDSKVRTIQRTADL